MTKSQKKSKLPPSFSLILCGVLIFFLGFLMGRGYKEKKIVVTQPKIEQKTSPKKGKPDSNSKDSSKQKTQIAEQEITFYKTLSNTDQSIKKESKDIRNVVKRDNKSRKGRVFTIQVGSFKKESQALTLKSRLKEKGYNVYIVNFRVPQGNIWYRVRIGSYNTKKEAYSIAKTIEKNEGLATFVTEKSK